MGSHNNQRDSFSPQLVDSSQIPLATSLRQLITEPNSHLALKRRKRLSYAFIDMRNSGRERTKDEKAIVRSYNYLTSQLIGKKRATSYSNQERKGKGLTLFLPKVCHGGPGKLPALRAKRRGKVFCLFTLPSRNLGKKFDQVGQFVKNVYRTRASFLKSLRQGVEDGRGVSSAYLALHKCRAALPLSAFESIVDKRANPVRETSPGALQSRTHPVDHVSLNNL